MKYTGTQRIFYIEENTVLSLGKFDGIHRGHEQLAAVFCKEKRTKELAGAIFYLRHSTSQKCAECGGEGADHE